MYNFGIPSQLKAWIDCLASPGKTFFGFIGISDAAFVRAEGVGLGPEQRRLALETALADVSALEAA
jgi:FMN-dependent NADH-azoreductase